MKSLVVFALAAAAEAAIPAQAQVDVSVGINQPGVYGRVNIGALPPPALVAPAPVVVSAPRVLHDRRPVYLYVPPDHQTNWARYCGRYSACGQPVYFVREDYVRERWVREHPGWERRHRWDERAHRYNRY